VAALQQEEFLHKVLPFFTSAGRRFSKSGDWQITYKKPLSKAWS
jgi:hypothetical protein